jgi:hypothetical protein
MLKGNMELKNQSENEQNYSSNFLPFYTYRLDNVVFIL